MRARRDRCDLRVTILLRDGYRWCVSCAGRGVRWRTMLSRPRRGGLACLLALVALVAATSNGLAAAAVAPRYLIVPNHSIAGVQVGEGAGAVVNTIGPPRGRAEPAGPQWLYQGLDVWMNSTQLQVIKLVVAPLFATESEAVRYATASGIRVGSTIGAVEKAYPAAKCSTKLAGCVLYSKTLSTAFIVAKRGQRVTRSTTVFAIEIS
jgi:hypothetical protein